MVFLVLARDLSVNNPVLKVFVSKDWKAVNPVELHPYLVDTIQHILSLPQGELDRFWEGLSDLSVGPLRFAEGGSCSESGFPDMLSRIFESSGYFIPEPQ